MTHIVLDDKQERIVAENSVPLDVRNAAGELIGYLVQKASPDEERLSDEEIAICKQRMASRKPGAGKTTEEVLQYLNSLRRS